MKRELPFVLLFSLFMLPVCAQVTRLSNNTSYEGFPLTDTKIILRSTIDYFLWVYDIPGNSFTKLSNDVTMPPQQENEWGVMDGKVYFAGKTVATGVELWVTDGTPGGTVLVKDINSTGSADSAPMDGFIVYNSELYFTANDGANGRELWKTNGSGPGTVMVKNINPAGADAFTTTTATEFKVFNGVLLFTAITAADGSELWKTDGTEVGTVQVKNIYTTATYGSFISDFTEVGSTLIFTAFDEVNGQAIWKTDGTTGGTTLVKDIDLLDPILPPPFPYNISISIFPPFFNFQNTLYFTGTDGTNGFELWKTDGTTSGTTMVKDIFTGPDDGFPQLFSSVKNNSKFFFTATSAGEGTELWQSDGTETGTTILKDIVNGTTGSDPIIIPDFFGGGLFQGNKFFFTATTPGEGSELYLSDGTPGGTAILKDINLGALDGIDLNIFTWFFAGNKLFFVANDGTNGAELWQSDGTGPGTTMAANVNTTPGAGSDISLIFAASNTLFFFGTDGDDALNTDFFKLDAALSLPLRWISFEARPSNDDVLLLWETGEEEQTDYFTVQRSADGRNYYDIGRVDANGVGSNHYSFTDPAAMRKSGVKKWFYRVKYVDKDGKSALSRTATVALNKMITSILFLPNPVANELKLVIESVSNDYGTLSITNMEGKTVLQKSIRIRRGQNTVITDASGLANGAYILKINTTGASSSERFLIQH